MPASTTTVLNFRGYQSGWICLNQWQQALRLHWISEVIILAEFFLINASQHCNWTEFQRLSVWLNLSESVTKSTKTALSFRGYHSGWNFLNQCQPALQLYWISALRSDWILTVSVTVLKYGSTVNVLYWFSFNHSKTILIFLVCQSGWIFMN